MPKLQFVDRFCFDQQLEGQHSRRLASISLHQYVLPVINHHYLLSPGKVSRVQEGGGLLAAGVSGASPSVEAHPPSFFFRRSNSVRPDPLFTR